MKVYVVSRSVDYEGSTILRVLDAKDKALAVCRNEAEKWWKVPNEPTTLESLPTGFKIADASFTYEEMEVQ